MVTLLIKNIVNVAADGDCLDNLSRNSNLFKKIF